MEVEGQTGGGFNPEGNDENFVLFDGIHATAVTQEHAATCLLEAFQ